MNYRLPFLFTNELRFTIFYLHMNDLIESWGKGTVKVITE
jgi:hypothetical protein